MPVNPVIPLNPTVAQAAPPFDLDNTLGALLVGGLFAVVFWSVTNAQTYVYYRRHPNDPPVLKLIVALLWVLDTFDVCLTSHVLYYYLVTNYLNPLAIATPVWSILAHVAMTSVANTVIRSLFALRIWRLSDQNITLTSIVGAITLCDLIVGLMIAMEAFRLQTFAQPDRIFILFSIYFGVEVSGDLFVALILCYYLFASSIGFRSTDTPVNTFIAYFITTGLLASVDAILGTTFYATMPTTFIFIGFYFNLMKLYINSYLALLNARGHLRERKDRPVSFRLSRLSDQRYTADFGPGNILSGSVDKEIEVRVQTTVDSTSETLPRIC